MQLKLRNVFILMWIITDPDRWLWFRFILNIMGLKNTFIFDVIKQKQLASQPVFSSKFDYLNKFLQGTFITNSLLITSFIFIFMHALWAAMFIQSFISWKEWIKGKHNGTLNTSMFYNRNKNSINDCFKWKTKQNIIKNLLRTPP
jgi:hypothetical protein